MVTCDIFPESYNNFGTINTVVLFLIGFIIMLIVDKLSHGHSHSHSQENVSHEHEHEKNDNNNDTNINENEKMYRLAITTFISLILHNIPEGCVVLLSSLQSHDHLIRRFLFLLAHNIPEGIMIALPYYRSRGNLLGSLKLTLLTGLSQLLGAIIGF